MHDGGLRHTRAFGKGRWNPTQASRLRHRSLRRTPRAVALSVRVSTSRPPQPQPLAPPRSRLRAHVAPPPAWPGAEAPRSRADGESGAPLTRPGLAHLRARAALAAVAGGGLTAPERVARPAVQPRLWGDALPPRGCRGAWGDRPRDAHPPAPRLFPMRGAVAEDARTWSAERRRRGRHATRRRGPLVPWPRAPSGSRLAPARPRAPSRGRLAPVQAAVVEPRLAWETDARQAPRRSPGAKRRSEAQRPTPRGGTRWQVAAGRGRRRAPTSMGVAARGRPRPAGVNPPCSRWGPARVSRQPQRRSGWPCRCRPAAARRPAKRPRPAGIVTGPWPVATRRPLRLDCAVWSAVARGGARAAVAPGPLAPMLTAVGAVPIRGGAPSAHAARRARPPRMPGRRWDGRPSAVA